ncbi:MAG: hypothetical protein K9M07_06065 [Simkaniaceae bacterium]|nr:hypothetical protein [Simkaniaceae bacterium]
MLQEKTFKDLSPHIWPLHSRVHPLNTYPAYIKREDELSFGMSGNKLRKLASLIPSLLHKKIKHVSVFGSAHSNFILAISQSLIEHQIPFSLLLKKPHHLQKRGNFAYLSRLIKPEQIIWIERDEINPHSLIQTPDSLFIDEGGYSKESLLGAMTLAESISRNEKEHCIAFDHICIDAGTGLSAIGLILGAAYLQKPWTIQIFSMKEDARAFDARLHAMHDKSLPLPPYQVHQLSQYKAFGSVPTSLLRYIDDFAQREGIFLDPLYSSKMFYELEHHHQSRLTKKTLIIHSGGALSLSGFQNDDSEE